MSAFGDKADTLIRRQRAALYDLKIKRVALAGYRACRSDEVTAPHGLLALL